MRSHFAQFDDELQDSDRTISTPARRLRPRARLPTVADASDSSSGDLLKPRRRFPTSAFFSDTTDDDVSRPQATESGRNQLSMSAYSCRDQTQTSRALLHSSAGPGDRRRRSGVPPESVRVPRLHVDAIQFPVTRAVLWDRRRLSAAPIGVSLGQVLPRFIVTAEALKQIYRLYGDEKSVRANGAPLCFLYGEATSPRVKKVCLERVKLKREDARAAGVWCVPVHTAQDGNNPGLSQESYVATIAAVQSSYRDEYADNVASKLQPKLLVFRSSPNAAQLDFQLECAASPVLFKFSLVRNLPLLMTPLAVSLAKREFNTRSSNTRSGYLTLDRTRKAVPLLKVDPLVLQQPLVGVWVYGVQIDDAWDEETARRQLADPFLYFACLGYLTSRAIKERVEPEKNTFLVALYPSSDADDNGATGSLPRFFECSFSEFLSPPATPLPMELYSYQKSCLVGVSKFSTDVELALSASPTSAWEAARCQVKIPTAPRTDDNSAFETSDVRPVVEPDNNAQEVSDLSRKLPVNEDMNETSGWTITTEALRKSATADQNALSHVSVRSDENARDATASAEVTATAPEVNEKAANLRSCGDAAHDMSCAQAANVASGISSNNASGPSKREWLGSNSYRSCCKTQQLLTIQHQQILENQQRQLHEMQDQITQLRRLLNAARSNNKNEGHLALTDQGYDSDASSSSMGAVADVSTTLSRHDGRLSSQSSMVSAPRQSDVGRFSDRSSAHSQPGNEKDEADEGKSDSDVSISSLGLSSVSSGSDADLSSLSSSLIGERLGSSQVRDKLRPAAEQIRGDGLDRTLLPENAGVQDVEVGAAKQEPLSDHGGQQHDDIVEDTAHDLSIGELSASLTETEGVDANKVDVTFAGRDEDDDDASDVDASGNDVSTSVAADRLLSPDAYLRKVGGFVDHHGGCFTTPPLDFHSFCVPRIKFSTEEPECLLSDSEDEEVRLIEQKYKRLMAA